MSNGITNVIQGVGDTVKNLTDDLQPGAQAGGGNGGVKHESEASETEAKVQSQSPAPVTKGTESQFNPFSVFRYHKFGPFIDGEYKYNLHYDKNLYGSIDGTGPIGGTNFAEVETGVKSAGAGLQYYSRSQTSGESGDLELFKTGERGKEKENPTASKIIEWAKGQDTSKSWSYGPAPYAATDFIYCKHYGKIPNNRLVTLRRYAMPIEDNIRMPDGKGPAIPLAQAVTWFGEEIDNPLKSILNISWDLKWDTKIADVWDVKGNEVLVDDLLDGLGITNEATANVVKGLVASSSGTDESTLELTGYDKKLQDYIEGAYKDGGPYWNQVLGPVNVVERTRMRQRGMGLTMFDADITINFEYSLRSYGGVNPKIAFLDLLANFLTLTYNNAPFWGGGYRYFERPGVQLPNQKGVGLIRRGEVAKGLKEILNNLIQGSGAAFNQVMDQLSGILSGKGADAPETEGPQSASIERDANGFNVTAGGGLDKIKDSPGDSNKLLDNFLSSFAASMLQKPLSYNSLLEGRPIGEWHLTVGNPMDPIAVLGNLYLKDVKLELGEALGMDDFPNEVSFKVTLGHGRPRAAQDIESMFNLGNGPMTFTQVKPPSSAGNTFGPENYDKTNQVYPDKNRTPVKPTTRAEDTTDEKGNVIPGKLLVPDQVGGTDSYIPNGKTDMSNAGVTLDVTSGGGPKSTAYTDDQKKDITETLSKRIGEHYGAAYGENRSLIGIYLSEGSSSR